MNGKTDIFPKMFVCVLIVELDKNHSCVKNDTFVSKFQLLIIVYDIYYLIVESFIDRIYIF